MTISNIRASTVSVESWCFVIGQLQPKFAHYDPVPAVRLETVECRICHKPFDRPLDSRRQRILCLGCTNHE